MVTTKEKKVKQTTVALPEDLRKLVEADAKAEMRSVSNVCVRIINEHYSQQRDS